MKLADWAREQGISYPTAYRWFKAGKLPVPAYQSKTGTIIIINKEDNMLQRRNNSLIDEFFGQDFFRVPAIDNSIKTLSKSDRFVLVIEVPGFSEEEIDVNIYDNVIEITGKHEMTKDDNYFSKETSSIKYTRTIPQNIDIENVTASCKNGLLEIILPKRNKKELRKVPLNKQLKK